MLFNGEIGAQFNFKNDFPAARKDFFWPPLQIWWRPLCSGRISSLKGLCYKLSKLPLTPHPTTQSSLSHSSGHFVALLWSHMHFPQQWRPECSADVKGFLHKTGHALFESRYFVTKCCEEHTTDINSGIFELISWICILLVYSPRETQPNQNPCSCVRY